jgi:hypothetical protein
MQVLNIKKILSQSSINILKIYHAKNRNNQKTGSFPEAIIAKKNKIHQKSQVEATTTASSIEIFPNLRLIKNCLDSLVFKPKEFLKLHSGSKKKH